MTRSDQTNPRRHWRIWILPVLIAAGIGIAIWQPLDFETLLEQGREVGNSPLFLSAAVVVMILLFTFGLPGSLGLWLIAPFNPPLIATALLVLASVGGALGGYYFAAFLQRDWHPTGLAARIFEVLKEQGNFVTQTGLRLFPGFPHSVLNFSGGVLRLPVPTFIAAAVIGLTVKWAVYARAVYGITDAVADESPIDPAALWPLALLAALLLAGAFLKKRLLRG